jgi:hypothetical protein
MTKLIFVLAALSFLAASGGSQAGQCKDAIATYNRFMAEDAAAPPSPENKQAVDAENKRMKENIIKGCAPGGFYDQLDKLLHKQEEPDEMDDPPTESPMDR